MKKISRKLKKQIEKEISIVFDSERMGDSLSAIDLKKCSDEINYYTKLKEKDSLVDSTTLMMRFG